MVGAARTMLDLAGEHARNRIQFGRPIGSFQAVRHRLADALVGIEMAEAMIDAAWLDRAPRTAAMAKSVAGRQARTAARHSQQVLAGIGFTTEHRLHHSVRRTLVLDALLGTGASLTRELGSEVISASRLPTLPPLWPAADPRVAQA
jgi:alkylation response protein AidB-like acyl-CoA dehydrogenase